MRRGRRRSEALMARSTRPSAAAASGQRPDLDRLVDRLAHARRPLDRRVVRRRLDEVEPAKLLLRLREGTVGALRSTRTATNDPRLVRLAQPRREDERIGGFHLGLEAGDPREALSLLL